MAAYNAEATIKAAIQSLLSQSFEGEFEIIVVDDDSTDQTLERVKEVATSDVHVIALSANVGRAEARNIAIRECDGSVVVVADADDVSLPGRLQSHFDEFQEAPNLAVSGGQLRDIVDDVMLPGSNLKFPVGAGEIDSMFDQGRMGIAHPASAFSRSWFEELNGYDPTLPWCEDYDLFARGWSPGTFNSVDDSLVGYRRRSAVTSWPYWWENQRHLSAINSRLTRTEHRARASELDIGPYLISSGRLAMRAYEFARFASYRAQLAAR